jgi:chemotaxis protein CheC
MTQLTTFQKDALTELINIAFSRAAASLSNLTHTRVDLDVPEVNVHRMLEIASTLKRFVTGDIATVHQMFAGQVEGDAFLLLNIAGAVHLVELLTGAEASPGNLSASSREVITEVGNILMNACLGVFGNLLNIRFSYSVPKLNLEDVTSVVDELASTGDPQQHALVVGARFKVRGSEVTGCLVLVLGIDSFDLFLRAVESWAQKSIAGS